MRLILVSAGLVQLLVMTPWLLAQPRRLDPVSTAQAVVNQQQADQVDELSRRLDRLDQRLESLRIGERLAVLEQLPVEINGMRQVQYAIFTALAMNLIATIIQIRTQTTRRDAGVRHDSD